LERGMRMGMTVNIWVNRAKRGSFGNWEVAFGGGADFRYEPGYQCKSFEELSSRLREVAERLASDSRLSAWPGYRVSAENAGNRKPNGWDKRRADREVYVTIKQNEHAEA